MEETIKMTLADILKDSNYKLTQFSAEKVNFLEENITVEKKKSN